MMAGIPPDEYKFKKGNPGGPGRPKGSLNLKTRMLNQLLKPTSYPDLSKEPIVAPGQKPKMRECKGVVMDKILASMVNQAMKGNTKAAELCVLWTGETIGRDSNDVIGEKEVNKFEIHVIDPNGYLKDKEDECKPE